MKEETCRTCKFSCRWCISKTNPKKYSFYCTKLEDRFNDEKKCGIYQKDSRFREE